MKLKIFILFLLILPFKIGAEAVLSKGHDTIFLMEEDGTEWTEIQPGAKLLKKAQIKTGPEGTAIILIQNNVKCYMRENTIIQLMKIGTAFSLAQARRGGYVRKYITELKKTGTTIKLKLIQGAINLLPEKSGKKIVIETLLGDIISESKNCLIKNINNNIIISVFDNQVSIKIKDEKIKINQGYGLERTPTLDNTETFPLPDSPFAEYPEHTSIITNVINLKWKNISEAILYRLEISKDEEFVEIVNKVELNNNFYPVEDLEDGEYYWRVSAINRKNLEGAFFDHSSFFIQQSQASLIITKKEEEGGAEEEEKKENVPIHSASPRKSITLVGVILISLISLIIF